MTMFDPCPDIHFIDSDEKYRCSFIEEPTYNPFSSTSNERVSPISKSEGVVSNEKTTTIKTTTRVDENCRCY